MDLAFLNRQGRRAGRLLSSACLLAWLLLPHSLSPPPILLWACQAGRQASRGREAGRQEGRRRVGGLRPSLSSPLSPSRLLLVVYSASAFAAFAVRRSCFVLAEDAWLARPPFPSLPSLPPFPSLKPSNKHSATALDAALNPRHGLSSP